MRRTDWGGTSNDDPEQTRLAESAGPGAPWRQWGPYLSARQWGTVREDYSAGGDAWAYFPFDHARSRAYRWGEDGLGGISDRWQHLNLALALWNGRDPILKERLFGLTNGEGNHGEDVKEHWWSLDATPTSSYLRWLYRYPQAEFPYAGLRAESSRRSRHEPEYELADTGVLDGNRFFDVEVTYAKAAPDDICMLVRVTNRGPEPAPLHVLPTLWFRNTWGWGRDERRPQLHALPEQKGLSVVAATHATLGDYWLAADGAPPLLVTDNETNSELLFGTANTSAYVKDGIGEHVIRGAATVNPDGQGTKAAAWYRLDLAAGETRVLRLRLSTTKPSPRRLAAVDEVVEQRRAECDLWADGLCPPGTPDPARRVQRAAVAGLLWARKAYRYEVREWLEGDPHQPPPPAERWSGRNSGWRHLYNADVISMPDEWEYPWYAAWDLAFHTVPLAFVDPDFAKEQLVLLCREWYMHPSGQLPAYEWELGDVNPPVHAWAAWRVYKIDAKATGTPDREFLARVFHKLLLNFSWWVNRKDADGSNVFEGGFLGLDNIGLFDRSAPLPSGGRLEQSDATSWMAMFSLNMLAIALELARGDRAYEDVATKFFEHFLAIAHATTAEGRKGEALWDDDDGFFYDVLFQTSGGQSSAQRLRVRSLVGLLPLLAVETLDASVFEELPDFAARVSWYVKNRPDLCSNVFTAETPGEEERRMLSLVNADQLVRVLTRMLDTEEFLSPHGIRSLSAAHRDPVRLVLDGVDHQVDYEPAESTTPMFGGNSNWRGPVWMPVNFLLVEALQKYHHYYGDALTVAFPSGGGEQRDLGDVADELSRRLIGLFLPGPDGWRPADGADLRRGAPADWSADPTFYEYFHGDTGVGLGASHQTGWTALVAKLIRQLGPEV
ncbi:MAG: hypothetical protein JWP11_2276 [Frankiales bacterium]|nr:hypothetical protein [Frankiales bacterium]